MREPSAKPPTRKADQILITKAKPNRIKSIISQQHHTTGSFFTIMKFTTLALLSLVASAGAFAPSVVSPRSLTSLDMARKPFISGNWKLNPQTREEALTLAQDIAASITDKSPDSDVALFVPYVFIEAVKGAIGESTLNIGAEVNKLHPGMLEGASTGNSAFLTLFFYRAFVPRSKALSQVLCRRPCLTPSALSGHWLVIRNVELSSGRMTNTSTDKF